MPGIKEDKTATTAIKADNFKASNSRALSILFTFYSFKAMFTIYFFCIIAL